MANPVVMQIANEGLDFFNQLRAQQQTTWGNNQAALQAINKAWGPVLASGAVPYGYSAGLDSLLQANVLQTSGTATANAENAAALQAKQASGGANVSPTGSQEAINAEILAKGQQSAATGLQQEKIAGYEQGLKNLEGGTEAENDVLNATNPERAASAATSQGGLAEAAGAEQFKENQETGPLAIASSITGDIGNVAKAAEGFAGSGLIPGGSSPSLPGIVSSGGASPTGQPGGVFHKGGIVPGKKGKEVSAKLKAGEYVIPAPKTKRQKTILDRVLVNAQRG